MRVLIDTNILVSALLCDGLPETIILWVLNNPEWEWVVSASIMQEYEAVLMRKKFKFSDEFVNRWLELIMATVTVYIPNTSKQVASMKRSGIEEFGALYNLDSTLLHRG